MLWHMGHIWMSGVRFSFNTHNHLNEFLNQVSDITVHIKEGETKGESISMILYGLGVLPITRLIQHHVMDVKRQCRSNNTHVWYYDGSFLALKFARIKAWFTNIDIIGSTMGYHPETVKSFLITSKDNVGILMAFFH